jgi:hypothetical protein
MIIFDQICEDIMMSNCYDRGGAKKKMGQVSAYAEKARRTIEPVDPGGWSFIEDKYHP